ncbi:hypothetical protein [Streptomyces olivochromogenes]|uniref:Uncharacterized protein n=1 Tax=Streptomyces olivochromogenes TaxID=1963 RepID=A0A250VT63_STROL|nr:hypothetical protein [Streptomyces olivochromogenes]KUN38270.1 hypothetical protein AQJ27_45040 [Streptomyces olivochromogenes]GAX57286.1 hypothetical protein SO3561_08856 [Streptomyces olivochromogenes]
MRKRSGRPPRFAAIPNETIDDSASLDFMALALLSVLLRHRDGWNITLAVIGAKYGYGRDALAKAMGFLQVARYVVKIRIMSAETNQWSTEMCVYDTPATDAEVAALLEAVRREPDVRAVQVIEPTEAAVEHAAKRRAKLQPADRRTSPSVAIPRVPENPHSGAASENGEFPQVSPECRDSRQSGNPAVFKKTVSKKTGEDEEPWGDGRRPSTGRGSSSAGGSAASGKTKPPFSRDERAQYDAFVKALPSPLAALVPRGLPDALVRAVLAAVDISSPEGRTVEQLVRYRLMPKWDRYYSSRDQAGPIEKPVGVLVAMLRRDAECGDARCDERTNVDTGQACSACEMRAVDRRADREKDRQTSDAAVVPAAVPGPRTTAPRASAASAVKVAPVVVDPASVPLGNYRSGAQMARAGMVDKAYRPR